ncbi:PorP/SprF family type IX secretion system membrane protein [Pseudopedobacter beijingensis]|uniref:PorP/SprF family type IX secretion system membrane protein n=1 Tax=Pseudopedobacter beijingensis TaxID=1207056 RepID=A0ABW4IDE4_9SPHI
MKQLYKYLAGLFIGIATIHEVSAQLNPLGNMYFQNQYLGNPAFAGAEKGLNANLVYRKQFNQIPGTPVTQSITGDYGFANRTAVGLNLSFEKSGLINHTRFMATYAYHLPIAEDKQVHFGLSLGVAREYINNRDITGDSHDPVTNRFNDRGGKLDGDFGVAYTDKKLTLQASVLNLGNYLETDPNFANGVNYATFFTAVAYKIELNNQFTAEPKIGYRGIKEFDNILDVGANFNYQNKFNVFGLYHTTESATFGFGVGYNNALTFTGMYTTNTAAMKGYTNGDFELGINYRFSKKKTNNN